MPRHPAVRRHRRLSVVGDDPLPEVRIDGVGTVPMSDEQYTAAVHALATLIQTWWAARTRHSRPATVDGEDTERPLAA